MSCLALCFKANKKRVTKAGFSLIELLAVIAVISILTSIIIPIVGSVRNSAKTTKSLSNLRQIASAMQMYSSDNNGLYPVGYDYKGTGFQENYWYLEISEYLSQETISNNELQNILVSPFAEKDLAKGYFDDNEVKTTPNTYSVHGVICPDTTIEDSRFPIWNIKENHSEIILVAEGTQLNNGFAKAVFDTPLHWYTMRNNPSASFLENELTIYDESTSGALSYRANEKALTAFLDGHVEALEKGTVKLKNVVISR